MVRSQFHELQVVVVHLTSEMMLWCITCGAILAVASALPIAKPHCQSSCGGIAIPYPFGIGAGCYLTGRENSTGYDEYSFQIFCDNSTRPFLSNTSLEVLEISIEEGTLQVRSPITFANCRNKPNNRQPPNLTGYPYWYSGKKNRFTSMSCGRIALMTLDSQIGGGCLSICGGFLGDSSFIQNNSCSGIDCCQTAIPFAFYDFNASFGAVVYYEMKCKSAFLVDQRWFTLNSTNISTITDKNFVPVVLKWSVFQYSNIDIYGLTNWTDHHNSTHISDDENLLLCSKGFQGNPYLIDGCQDINECEEHTYGAKCGGGSCINKPGGFECQFLNAQSEFLNAQSVHPVKLGIIVTSTSIGLLFILVGGWWSYKVIKKRKNIKRKQKFFKQNGGLLLEQQLSSGEVNVEKIKVFNSKELEKATDHFNVDRILGQGGQGTVYKGMLEDGRIVAVKKSKIVDCGDQEVRQFINEIVILSQIIHRNVVKLLGCCLETEVPLLVYEFIANGTLSEYIHQQNEEFPLTWKITLQVAIEVAGALSYLHSAAAFPIYHRDIKSSNILLDDKYRAKVADFGTSRSVSIDQTHLTTLVHGTFGYLDPEYFQSSQFTDKSDVYSFGVVLAELLTGQKPVSLTRSQEAGRSLATYFLLSMEQNRVFDILDVRVMKDGGKEEIMKVANLAKRCLNLNGRKRPTMKEVAAELEGIQLSVNTSNHGDQNLANVAYVQPQERTEDWDVVSTSTGPCTDGGSFSCDAQPLLTS